MNTCNGESASHRDRFVWHHAFSVERLATIAILVARISLIAVVWLYIAETLPWVIVAVTLPFLGCALIERDRALVWTAVFFGLGETALLVFVAVLFYVKIMDPFSVPVVPSWLTLMIGIPLVNSVLWVLIVFLLRRSALKNSGE